jgi:hypothetical protein
MPKGEATAILVADTYGQYIPQLLTEVTSFEDWDGITMGDWSCIHTGPSLPSGEPNEWYWEAMGTIENNATWRGNLDNHPEWRGCRLYYNGDLFLVDDEFGGWEV